MIDFYLVIWAIVVFVESRIESDIEYDDIEKLDTTTTAITPRKENTMSELTYTFVAIILCRTLPSQAHQTSVATA